MIYLKGIFIMVTILMVITPIYAGSTKITYKKPIYGKSNALKDKRIPQKAPISPKAQDIGKTTTKSTMSTTTASPMTTKIVEPTIVIENNNIIALTTATYSSGATVSATTSNVPENVDTREGQLIEKIYSNTKDNKGEHSDNKGTTLAPTTPLSPPSEEEVAAELITLPEAEPEVDVLVGANSQTVAVVQSPINASSKVAPLANKLPESVKSTTTSLPISNQPVPCTCGVFLSSQFKRGSNEQPTGQAVIINELERNFACNAIGQKQCQTKCLEIMVQHLPNSANILCATLDRDCRKERAYLFTKNCRDKWFNTNLAAGREYCCKNGRSYSCPLV